MPQIKYNLLSTSKLTKELQCLISFYPDRCVFQDLYDGEVKRIGREANGLYIFTNTTTINDAVMIQKRSNLTNFVPKYVCDYVVANANLDIVLWHKVLGHASTHVLRKTLPMTSGIIFKKINQCAVCPCAK